MRPLEGAEQVARRMSRPRQRCQPPAVQPYPILGACRVWGVDNREAPLRLSASAGAGAQNWEFRALDATANPHLALAAIIAAGCDARARHVSARAPPWGVTSLC